MIIIYDSKAITVEQEGEPPRFDATASPRGLIALEMEDLTLV